MLAHYTGYDRITHLTAGTRGRIVVVGYAYDGAERYMQVFTLEKEDETIILRPRERRSLRVFGEIHSIFIDNNHLVVVEDRRIRVLGMSTLETINESTHYALEQGRSAQQVSVSRDLQALAVHHADGVPSIWYRGNRLDIPWSEEEVERGIGPLAFNSTGTQMASVAQAGHQLTIRNLKNLGQVEKVARRKPIEGVCFTDSSVAILEPGRLTLHPEKRVLVESPVTRLAYEEGCFRIWRSQSEWSVYSHNRALATYVYRPGNGPGLTQDSLATYNGQRYPILADEHGHLHVAPPF